MATVRVYREGEPSRIITMDQAQYERLTGYVLADAPPAEAPAAPAFALVEDEAPVEAVEDMEEISIPEDIFAEDD